MNPMDLYACQWESKDCGSTCDMSNIAIVIQSLWLFLRVVCRITLCLSVCHHARRRRIGPEILFPDKSRISLVCSGSVISHVHWTDSEVWNGRTLRRYAGLRKIQNVFLVIVNFGS